MSTEIDELKQARYRSGKTISGHNAFLRPPTGETNSVDTRGFYFVLKEPHPNENRVSWKDRKGLLRRRHGIVHGCPRSPCASGFEKSLIKRPCCTFNLPKLNGSFRAHNRSHRCPLCRLNDVQKICPVACGEYDEQVQIRCFIDSGERGLEILPGEKFS